MTYDAHKIVNFRNFPASVMQKLTSHYEIRVVTLRGRRHPFTLTIV